jgi:signal transduction histidine kinase
VETARPGRFRWIDWMLPAGLADRESVRRARLTAGLAVLWALMSGVGAAYTSTLYGPAHLVPMSLLAMIAILAGILFMLRRSKSARPAANAVVLTLLCGEVLISATQGGLRSPALIFFSVVILIGGFLTGWRTVLVCAGLTQATFLVFFTLEVAGVSFPHTPDAHPILSALIIQTIVIVLVVASIRLYESARARAFAQLGASEANLAALVGNTTDAIWSVDRQLRPNTLNRVALERFAGNPHAAEWAEHYRRALAGDELTVELSGMLDGARVDLEVAFNPIVRDGEVTGVAVFARDIAERTRQARRLEQVQHELVDASRLAGMAEVATGVVHDIGNALNAVTVSAGLLAEHVRAVRLAPLGKLADVIARIDRRAMPDDEERILDQVADYLRELRDQLAAEQNLALEELDHLSRQLDHLPRLVARHEARAGVFNVEEQVRVDDVIDAAVQLATAAVGQQIPVMQRASPSEEIRLDRHKVTRILSNLIANAAQSVERAGASEGRITIAAERAGDRLSFEVVDNGVGIDPANAALIFAQDYSASPDGKGHGLGLHWSALAAREIGGSLTCASDGVGHGACFRLDLPVHAAEPRPGMH